MDFSAFFESEVDGPAPQPEVFMGTLSEEGWKQFLSVAQPRRFQVGEILVHQGEVSRAFFLVASGSLEVFFRDQDGNEQHVYSIQALSIFGEQAFFDGFPRSASVRALAAGELFGITPEAFELLSSRHPDIARIALLDLGRILSRRLREMTELVIQRRVR